MKTQHDLVKRALLAGIALLATVGVAQAQNTVSLTAARQTALMSDGASVPMWGWVCSTTTAAVGHEAEQPDTQDDHGHDPQELQGEPDPEKDRRKQQRE